MHPHSPVLKKVERKERQRSNWLMTQERRALAWLCARMPQSITSNMLTALGLFGSVILAATLFLASGERWWLLAGIFGLAVNWLGDSLDGRLAYYRKRPRKWFGFALDLMVDWASLGLVTLALAHYLSQFAFIPFVLMAAYGARMLIAAVSYKITEEYRIDSGKVGPTEARLLMAGAFVLECFFPASLLWLSGFALLVLLLVDVLEVINLLKLADTRDRLERSVGVVS